MFILILLVLIIILLVRNLVIVPQGFNGRYRVFR